MPKQSDEFERLWRDIPDKPYAREHLHEIFGHFPDKLAFSEIRDVIAELQTAALDFVLAHRFEETKRFKDTRRNLKKRSLRVVSELPAEFQAQISQGRGVLPSETLKGIDQLAEKVGKKGPIPEKARQCAPLQIFVEALADVWETKGFEVALGRNYDLGKEGGPFFCFVQSAVGCLIKQGLVDDGANRGLRDRIAAVAANRGSERLP